MRQAVNKRTALLRASLGLAAAASVVLLASGGTASSTSPYDVSGVARITGTVPAWLFSPETQFNCISRLGQAKSPGQEDVVSIRQLCLPQAGRQRAMPILAMGPCWWG
jgi:hypothetical protein